MRIAFYSADPGNHRFIQPIIDRLALEGHECQLYNNWTIDETADVYWFDFCDNNLIVATRENKEELKKKKVIARLHAIEYYMGFHNQIDWSCVDHLIFVSEHMKKMCNVQGVEQHVIGNGIDLDKLKFKERQKGFVLGYAGNIVPTKGILIMFHYLRELLNYDHRYTLKMVGLSRFHGREGEYYEHYKKGLPITESGEVSNIDEWLDGIDYLWQPSLCESFSLIVGEAMAKGIKPLINNYYGSTQVWPHTLVYKDFTEFYKLVRGPYESNKYREYVSRYSMDSEMEKINAITK
jgi:glycosyltransferase involved in cell wall biosynthesis